ncbi:MAG: type II toxin-antitoxin system Phd/YefM family antitoxin, partial [Candidatus Acidiferrales bacterium]
MVVTAKELRQKTSQILKKVQRGGTVTVTLRGKPVARISALEGKRMASVKDDPAIGMWADREDMR